MILAVCELLVGAGVEEAFLQPSGRNVIAQRCYAGAGFELSTHEGASAAAYFRTELDTTGSVFFVKSLARRTLAG